MKTTNPETWTVHHFVRDDSEPTELGLYEIEEVNEQLNEMAKSENYQTMQSLMEIAEKNKKLISAAPALLHACRCALADLEGIDEPTDAMLETIQELRAAIAIADGEQI